jgi:tungstate transport system substrate-binding protein
MLVNPKRHPRVKVKEGGAFVGWLVSADAQNTIVAYRAGGEQLFFADAR